MFQTNETCETLNECYLMSNIPKINVASGRHLLKKIDQPSWRTTRRNYKHIPQVVAYHSDSECCTFFHGNLSNPKSSEDTLIYLYVIWNMLKSAHRQKSRTVRFFEAERVITSRGDSKVKTRSFDRSFTVSLYFMIGLRQEIIKTFISSSIPHF